MTQSPTHPPINPSPAAGEAGRGYRNTLGPAYQHAESLYNNAVALSQILDAYSRRHRAPDLTPDARDYISHNLLNAGENLALLRQTLADSLDTQQEPPCHPNAASAADAAATKSNIQTETSPTPPSAPNPTNGPTT